MFKLTPMILTITLAAGAVSAETTIVSQPPVLPNAANDGIIAGESDRFGDFRGVYPADQFVLENVTTLEFLDFYGSNQTGGNTTFLYSGFTITIFEDGSGTPVGLPYDPSGDFGTTALIQLPNVAEGGGLSYTTDDGGVINVRIDVEAAMGSAVTLDPGTYWISVGPRMPDTPVGDPSGRWNWKMSAVAATAPPLWIDSDIGNWTPVSSLRGSNGVSMAWALTGIEVDRCPTDFSGNGVTDFSDLLDLLGSWGACSGCPADLDGNGAVDFTDVLTLLGAWGPC